MTTTYVLVAAVVVFQAGAAPPNDAALQADVDRLVLAAHQSKGNWPSQPPPPIPEVAVVARHGRRVTPLLLALLSDDPNAQDDDKRWRVQQQVSLTLSRIYSETEHCGRIYCDGDPRERIGHVKAGWLRVIASDSEMRALSSRELLDRFNQESVFWRQFEIGEALAATGDRTAIAAISPRLTHDDRHLRGNAAFVIGRLGDPRGFATIAAILADRSSRGPGQGIPGGRWTEAAQIRADRYYAAHLLGDLKDPRGVDLLIPLLGDDDVSSVAPWALGEIGDKRAVAPLVEQLERNDPTTRVLAISALERLSAQAALPKLRELQSDNRRANFGGQLSVSDAAKHAIAVLSFPR
jgi:HEAT repeat protein/PBS lyase HEAT-like repeat-containing protein